VRLNGFKRKRSKHVANKLSRGATLLVAIAEHRVSVHRFRFTNHNKNQRTNIYI